MNKIMELQIKNIFKDICPPLTKAEFNQLEKSIINEGCRDNLIVWNNTIIDGHNRYEICKKHGIDFGVTEHDFADKKEAKIWIIDNQKARRNLTDGWKFELAQVRKKLLAKKGKEKYNKTVGRPTKQEKSLSTIDNKKHNTRKEIAKDLGWSTGKVAMADKVWKEAEPEVKDKIKDGETSINQAYKKVKRDEKKKERKKEIGKQKEAIKKGKTDLPEGKFEVINIDPPWSYGTKYDSNGRRVASPYPEMSQKQLKELDIPASEDSILFLWTTHKFIFEAKELLKHWGFEYRNMLVWDKDQMGIGNLFRMQCEFCLVGIKGKPLLDNNHKNRDIIREQRREHSRKPEKFYKMVENLCVGRKLDYFSREKRDGWKGFGNETNKF